jgi:predicted branched-subunit amino acid permease
MRSRKLDEEATRALSLGAGPAVAVGLFGIAFGVLAVEVGLSPLQAVVMSALTFVGSAQYAAISVLPGGGVIAAGLSGASLNLRYLFLGASVAESLTGGRPRRGLLAQLVIEESWAIGAEADGGFSERRILVSGLLIYATWVGGTLLGTLGALNVADIDRLGLDAVFPMLFFLLLTDQLRSRARVVVAAVAGCAGLLAGLAVSTSAALVGAIALALAAGVVVDD